MQRNLAEQTIHHDPQCGPDLGFVMRCTTDDLYKSFPFPLCGVRDQYTRAVGLWIGSLYRSSPVISIYICRQLDVSGRRFNGVGYTPMFKRRACVRAQRAGSMQWIQGEAIPGDRVEGEGEGDAKQKQMRGDAASRASKRRAPRAGRANRSVRSGRSGLGVVFYMRRHWRYCEPDVRV